MRTITVTTILLILLTKQGNAQNSSRNQFALDFFKQASLDEKGNIFFSPFSLSTAMGMTYAGAKGVSQDQIAKVFHFAPNSEKFHKQQGNILKRLNAKTDSVQLNIVNSLWAEKTYPFKGSYSTLMKKAYSAKVRPMDFINKPEESRLTINRDIYKSTNEKIKDLLPLGSLNNLTRLVLTNAIYFKGEWKIKFQKERTSEANFHITPQNVIKCKMMGVKSEFNYYEGSKFQALELPYAGGNFSMVIILPAANQPLDELSNSLSNTSFDDIFKGFNNEEVIVSIPKFKLSKGYQLKEILSNMGMPQPFTDDADFTRMTSLSNLKISDVYHKAFIEVNEQGTEAAAATAVVIAMKSIGHDTFFIANRPFLFLIREKSANTILFMGRIVDPTKSE